MHPRGREAPQWLPIALLAIGGAVAAALILFLNRSGNFYYDEWDWFAGAAQLDAAKLFESDNGHLVLVPRLIYELVLSLFGTHYLPFMLVNVALVLTNSALLFVLARRRVGDWLALVPAVFLLFLGSGWDVLASGVGINVNIAVACALGAFLALERGTLAGDLLAGGLVAAGLASLAGEVAVAIGGMVFLVGQGRWQRIWVMLVPLALFGIWNTQTERSGGGQVTVDNLGGLSLSLFDSVSATMAATTGVFPTGFSLGLPDIDVTVARPIAAVAIAGLVYLLVTDRRLTPRFLSYGTVVALLWLSIGVVGRNPGTGRYGLLVLPFVFLAMFELVAGREIRSRWWVVASAVLLLGLMANLNALRNGAAILRYHGAADSGVAAALELQARRVEGDEEIAGESVSTLAASADPYGSDMIYVTAGDYLRAAREFGSAGYAPTEIATAPEHAREGVDRTLLAVLDPRLAPTRPTAATGRAGCTALRQGSGAVVVPPGGLEIRTSSTPAEIQLRRFAEISTNPPLVLPARAQGALSIPGDELPQPWTADVRSRAPMIVCPLHGGAPIAASR